jgi:hypothetical protein
MIEAHRDVPPPTNCERNPPAGGCRMPDSDAAVATPMPKPASEEEMGGEEQQEQPADAPSASHCASALQMQFFSAAGKCRAFVGGSRGEKRPETAAVYIQSSVLLGPVIVR